MTDGDLKKFVDTYQKYYFYVGNDEKNLGKEKLGVSIMHPTIKEDEEEIIGYLNNGVQNIKTIAWKMGGMITEDGIKTQYYEYSKDNISYFCDLANERKLSITKNTEISEDDIRNNYDEIVNLVKECDLVGYGSVYIISSMFFLSKGNVPIYDYYANVAVKALLTNRNPQDIYVGQAPGKDEHAKGDKMKKLAVNMLIDYRDLLKQLAEGTDYFNKKGFISRELDQALWVYGHATKRYPDEVK